ncbi:DNA-binding transcriptional regulator, AcrR family [Amycolatopsis arida]|uniref:DNA-binding transcriptional regulator, AcrR family n=1 Tax=Amycolatopsis arida TaxID=587909 RepID=A0A1I5WJC2_9PSEU|nr:TetR/AcrR family transcriptional regulator [Amycolatopsis arida]TDX92309.1 AcrR family transcriptional regulator [Amycolatopsis arida]SFQ19697.1 DNA-binding transcriptional regulator, AcrR family [Amycolatopsis arida]
MTTTRKERAAETEAALKEAARRVFSRQGYLNTKITDITAEAGRAAGSFYNHFASKEELLEALLTDLFAAADQEVDADPRHTADFTDRDSVRWHVAAFWQFYRAHLPELVALRQAAMVDERFRRRLRDLVTADRAHLADHLAPVRHLPGPPHLVLSAMSGLLDQFAWTWLVEGDTEHALDDDEAVEFLTEFLHRALTRGG